MAIPYGKMIPVSIVVSPDKRGRTVIETQNMMQVGRQLRKRGWTLAREIWLAPIGWKDSTTIIFPFGALQGTPMFGFRFYDVNSERNVVICTNRNDEGGKKMAEIQIRNLGWKLFRGQWKAP